MEPSIVAHAHAITNSSDFKMMMILFGGFGFLLTIILMVLTSLCGVIYRNTKDKCRTCNERILGDINAVADQFRAEINVLRDGCIACKAARKKEATDLWAHIEESVWPTLEKCCPRLSVEMAKLWNRKKKTGEETE